jgi:perosamine synthetase
MKNRFENVENIISKLFLKENSLFTRNAPTAIWLLLKSLGLKKKTIIVPSNICFVVNAAIILSDNYVKFVDIDKNYSIDPLELEKYKSKDIAAVIFPHMYGNMGDIRKVIEISRSRNWVVIEDVCQSLGSNNNGKFAGSFSDFAITSFGTGKIIDMEVGGILSTNSNSIYMSALEDYSKLKTYDNKIHSASKDFSKIYDFIIAELNKSDHSYMLGDLMIKSYKDTFVSKLDDKKYPVLELEKRLIELNKNIQLRNKKANFFQKNIKHKNIKVLIHNEGSTYWRQNILVSKNRDELLSFLKRNNVKATKYFPSLDKLFYHQGKKLFKNSNKMGKQIINLWPGEETSQKDIIKINELIEVFYEKN